MTEGYRLYNRDHLHLLPLLPTDSRQTPSHHRKTHRLISSASLSKSDSSPPKSLLIGLDLPP